MSFWRQISPRRAVTDFANEWRQPNPYRWRVLGAETPLAMGEAPVEVLPS